ncbi:hypothetical protein H671_8g19796 [Cricetulus griseus]|nr:hypothetical protein H671_8g19796 [Cricetulus griseus]
MDFRPVGATQQIAGQPGSHSKTLSPNDNETTKPKSNQILTKTSPKVVVIQPSHYSKHLTTDRVCDYVRVCDCVRECE